MDKYKLINLALFALSLLMIAGIFAYWELVCKSGGCTHNQMDVILRPVTQIGTIVSVVFGVLIFLPSHYFGKWLIFIFLWLFPLYIILIYKLGDNSSNFLSFPYALVAQLLGYLFAGISLVFVLSRFIYIRFFKKT